MNITSLMLLLVLVSLNSNASLLGDYIKASPENFCKEALINLKSWSCPYQAIDEKFILILEKAKYCGQNSKIEVIADVSNEHFLTGQVKIKGSFSANEPEQECTVYYSARANQDEPYLDQTYTVCEVAPQCNQKSLLFQCKSINDKTDSIIFLSPEKLYFSQTEFAPAKEISEKSVATPFGMVAHSIFYSWECNEKTCMSSASSNFEVQRSLFQTGEGQIWQSWSYENDKGIKNWNCSRIK